jgi:hypothetical protein
MLSDPRRVDRMVPWLRCLLPPFFYPFRNAQNYDTCSNRTTLKLEKFPNINLAPTLSRRKRPKVPQWLLLLPPFSHIKKPRKTYACLCLLPTHPAYCQTQNFLYNYSNSRKKALQDTHAVFSGLLSRILKSPRNHAYVCVSEHFVVTSLMSESLSNFVAHIE